MDTKYFPSIEAINNASKVLEEILEPTPFKKNDNLSDTYQANVYLKREDLQMVRSYKIRGAYNKIRTIDPELVKNGIVCASAGNHAQGVAFSCSKLKIMGSIFMPVTTPKQKIEQVRMFGKEFIEIVLTGDTFDAANSAAIAYAQETGKTFTVEALSAKVEYDKEGQKDILFMVDEFSGHKFSFKGAELIPGKPLVDGEYSSEAATIDIAYCVHGYGDVYGDMTSAKATVANDLEAATTTFNIEWVYEGNTYQLSWSGAVAGINYADDVVAEPLDFAPVYVEMVKVSSNDRYFYFYDRYENELVLNYYNGKIIMPYINYEGSKIDIDTNDFTFEYSDNGLGKEDGLYTYNVRLLTLDGRLIEFSGNVLTYYSNN